MKKKHKRWSDPDGLTRNALLAMLQVMILPWGVAKVIQLLVDKLNKHNS
jgi:hypothetical protein